MTTTTGPAGASDAPEDPGSVALECEGCGLIARTGGPTRLDAHCPRCGVLLERADRHGPGAALALATAASVLLGATLALPFLTLDVLGQEQGSRIASGAGGFADYGLWPIALLVLGTLVLAPALRLGLRLATLVGLGLDRPPRWLFAAFRWHERLRPWAMAEVFLLGAAVSYNQLANLATVEVGPAAWALVLYVATQAAADAALVPQTVWRRLQERGCVADAGALAAVTPRPWEEAQVASCPVCRLPHPGGDGQPCPRCGASLHHRKPAAVRRAWALALAAAALYLPANFFPVMAASKLGQGGPHTILAGVAEIAHAGLWPLAIIVFTASIAVPVLKLAGLVLMLVATRRGSAAALVARTRTYRFIADIGRWSMVDVFAVGILAALVKFGAVASVVPGLGALFFAAVVVLTMLAAEAFDPRLMWDAAEANGREAQA